MARVYVSIGSNIDRERNIRSSMDRLRAEYGSLLASMVYESDPVGFEGGRFLNLVVGFDTSHSPEDVFETLRAIERQCNRTRCKARYSSRTLDLDLLLYDDRVIQTPKMNIPRDEILFHAFVLRPLAEIAGEDRHPINGRTFGQLWAEFDKSRQKIWPVPFDRPVSNSGIDEQRNRANERGNHGERSTPWYKGGS
uniref:2-amino-4-hydroxy-6-hydroxymethyldihydropteridine diphosphokinase n=1 Tax=Candidatus Kentrum sp. SD TaxID=2126332 RepID=A0A451BKH7_9GAMM|nr:MAG: 2-amino-4-hydroxy-6-hydroxymethyldihydropteridinediphosphokinase [Candidatus Kentron sp. SD]